jgi:hypothetical protein
MKKIVILANKPTAEQEKEMQYIGTYDCSICKNQSTDVCTACNAFDLFVQRRHATKPSGFELMGGIA